MYTHTHTHTHTRFYMCVCVYISFNIKNFAFLGCPVVKAPHSQCTGPRFDPWSGNQIPHATTKTQHSQANVFKKECCTTALYPASLFDIMKIISHLSKICFVKAYIMFHNILNYPIIRHLVVSTFHTVSEIFFMLNPRSEVRGRNDLYIFTKHLTQTAFTLSQSLYFLFSYAVCELWDFTLLPLCSLIPTSSLGICLLNVPCAYVALPPTLTFPLFSSSTNHTHLQGPV